MYFQSLLYFCVFTFHTSVHVLSQIMHIQPFSFNTLQVCQTFWRSCILLPCGPRTWKWVFSTTRVSSNPVTPTGSRARSASLERNHTQVVLGRFTLEQDIFSTKALAGVFSLALECESNPPTPTLWVLNMNWKWRLLPALEILHVHGYTGCR